MDIYCLTGVVYSNIGKLEKLHTRDDTNDDERMRPRRETHNTIAQVLNLPDDLSSSR